MQRLSDEGSKFNLIVRHYPYRSRNYWERSTDREKFKDREREIENYTLN
jgi:hypothetical protein